MDTRTKIVSREQLENLARGRELVHVSGHFDPLLAEHVRRIRKSVSPGRLLVVEITEPQAPLLPQRARAELVAALADVDFVILAGAAPARAPDADVTDWLIDHVRRRSNGAKA